MITKRLFISLLLMGSLLMGQTVWATTYYVDRKLPGSDSYNGTSESTPFLTIAKCVVVAKNPGDTCLVKNGTYPEPVVMRYSGTAGKPITLKNYPGHTPHLLFPDKTIGSNRIELVSIEGRPNPIRYVTIEGLHIERAYNGVKFTMGENLIFRKNKIHDTWYAPFLGTGYRVTIEQNLCYHTGDFTGLKHTHGMYLIGKEYVVRNNIIYDTVLYGIQIAAYPFDPATMPDDNYAGFSGVIANNTIAYTKTKSAIVVWNAGAGPSHMQGIRIENNILYENCTAASCTGSGIDFTGTWAIGTQISNNVFFASGTGGTAFVYGGTPSSTYFLSNNSTITNPNMRNAPATMPASPDFRLQDKSSVAVDRGLNLSVLVPVDFSGTSRPQGGGYDIGSYEFSDNVTAGLSPPSNLKVH